MGIVGSLLCVKGCHCNKFFSYVFTFLHVRADVQPDNSNLLKASLNV